MAIFVVLVLCFLPVLSASSQEASASFPKFNWSRSLPVDSQSPVIGELGGTEARSLVSMGGKIYAGIGYWENTDAANPMLPGAQVLVLDSSQSEWSVDLELDQRLTSGFRKYIAISALNAVTLGTDMNGDAIAPTTILFAGVWTKGQRGGTEVFYRTEASPWQDSVVAPLNLPAQPARSFCLYRDKITGIDRVFVGTTVLDGNQSGGIYSGAFDSEHQAIVWDATPEAWQHHPDTSATVANIRVAGFAECNGKLYAAAYDSIYERRDGTSPLWVRVFQHTMTGSNVPHGTGFRGLTAITDSVANRKVLLVAQEADPLLILKVDPLAGFSFQIDLNVSQFLSQQLDEAVGYGIGAYNNMAKYNGDLLIGLHLHVVENDTGLWHGLDPRAFFLIRSSDGKYELQQIIDPSLAPSPLMVATRSLLPSPFPDDPVGTLYASGFDTSYHPVHNTAWIYKGVPTSK
jgi:hypothetical protein